MLHIKFAIAGLVARAKGKSQKANEVLPLTAYGEDPSLDEFAGLDDNGLPITHRLRNEQFAADFGVQNLYS